jgi:putative tryptophan/tyrosine transport system substrate-binding protein
MTLVGGAAVWPFAAYAQQRAMPVVGLFIPSETATAKPRVEAFVQRLHELGWIEGRTVAIEYRWAEGRTERFAEIVAELTRLKVDVIVTAGASPVAAAKQATSRSSPSSLRFLRIQLVPALSLLWRVRAAISPACRT